MTQNVRPFELFTVMLDHGDERASWALAALDGCFERSIGVDSMDKG